MEDLVGKMTPQPEEELRSRGTPYSQYREREEIQSKDITVGGERETENDKAIENEMSYRESLSVQNYKRE